MTNLFNAPLKDTLSKISTDIYNKLTKGIAPAVNAEFHGVVPISVTDNSYIFYMLSNYNFNTSRVNEGYYLSFFTFEIDEANIGLARNKHSLKLDCPRKLEYEPCYTGVSHHKSIGAFVFKPLTNSLLSVNFTLDDIDYDESLYSFLLAELIMKLLSDTKETVIKHRTEFDSDGMILHSSGRIHYQPLYEFNEINDLVFDRFMNHKSLNFVKSLIAVSKIKKRFNLTDIN